MATINAIDSNIPIEISKGGTNASSMTTTNGTIIFDGTRLVTVAPGTATQVLTSNSPSAPTFQPAPATTVQFQVVSSDPASPVNSQVWYHSGSNTFKGYIGGAVKTFTVT